MKKLIGLRSIDRYVIGVLAALMVAGGLYLVGPWYLVETPGNGGVGQVYELLRSRVGTIIFGIILLIDGFFLAWAAARRTVPAKMLSWALFVGFFFRLYIFIGTTLLLESWRPPSYLTSATVVCVFAGYWLWVARNEGTT